MRALVTGANGLLGANLIDLGRRLGHEITALYRSSNSRSYLAQKGFNGDVNWVKGDILNPDKSDLDAPIDVVINAAGFASPFRKDLQKMNETNVTGTQRMFDFAVKRGAKYFVQISTIGCFGSDQLSETIDENSKFQSRPTPYVESKKTADSWLEGRTEMPVFFVHPCYFLGEWDAKPSSGSVFLALKYKKLKNYVNTQKNFAHVSDVARGIWQGVEKGAAGHYVLGGENVYLSDFFDHVLSEIGDMRIKLNSHSDEYLQDPLCSEYVKEFCYSFPVSCERARQDFGYSPRYGWKDSVADSLRYLERVKLLRSARS